MGKNAVTHTHARTLVSRLIFPSVVTTASGIKFFFVCFFSDERVNCHLYCIIYDVNGLDVGAQHYECDISLFTVKYSAIKIKSFFQKKKKKREKK